MAEAAEAPHGAVKAHGNEKAEIKKCTAKFKAARTEAMRTNPVLAALYVNSIPIPPQPPPPTAAEAEAVAQKVARIKALAGSQPSASPLTILSAL